MKSVRVGNGQGFWGDSLLGPIRLVEEGPLDYLTLDYLAEVTMSIMQKLKSRDPNAGYATDFVEMLRRILPRCKQKGIKVVANAGGVNPRGCLEAIRKVVHELGLKGVRVGIVEGDDILARLPELMAGGEAFTRLVSGLREALAAGLSRVFTVGALLSLIAFAASFLLPALELRTSHGPSEPLDDSPPTASNDVRNDERASRPPPRSTEPGRTPAGFRGGRPGR